MAPACERARMELAVLAFNLNSIMKWLVWGGTWRHKRLKAILWGPRPSLTHGAVDVTLTLTGTGSVETGPTPGQEPHISTHGASVLFPKFEALIR